MAAKADTDTRPNTVIAYAESTPSALSTPSTPGRHPGALEAYDESPYPFNLHNPDD